MEYKARQIQTRQKSEAIKLQVSRKQVRENVKMKSKD